MTARILDGRIISADIKHDLKSKVKELLTTKNRRPGLATLLIGDDPASQIYIRNKHQFCQQVGFYSKLIQLSSNISEKRLLSNIVRLNNNPLIDGILIQLPLPNHLNKYKIVEKIAIEKDVDGFHPYNIGCLTLCVPLLHPCTPKGVMTLLEYTGEKLEGLDAVIIGRSDIVGRPMALELLSADCTPTICHSQTKNLKHKVKNADIVIVAIGVPKFIPGEWIKEGALVIDVGINHLKNGILCGDIDFETARNRAAWITPVPGGVGPMTIATLMQNTMTAYHKKGLKANNLIIK